MFFPPAGGYRVGTFTVPPASTPPAEGIDVRAALADLEAALPGLLDHNEPDKSRHAHHRHDRLRVRPVRPGGPRTAGRVVLELDDGASVELVAGDTVVQNGTRHAWRNPFDETATLLVVLIGATPA
jgi:hypothetical protein